MCFTLLLVGCPSQDVEENDSSTPTVEAPRGRIAGVVVSETGEPIDGADVRAQSQLTTTDETGSYVFDYVYPDRDIVIEFSKRGFAKNYTSTTLSSWETVTSNVTLLEIDGSGQFAGSTGGTVQVNDVIAEFPANAVIDAYGSSFAGQVTAEVTYVNPHESRTGTPGDLAALAFKPDSEPGNDERVMTQLVSYGMVDITLYSDDGKLLTLSDEVLVDVTIPIFNGELPDERTLSDGDEQPAWSFSPDHGLWIEESAGQIVEDVDHQLFFKFQASHFSWWNCDQGFVPTCASGRVVDFLEFPVRGAQVTCSGGQTTSVTTTDDDGYYNCSVFAGDSVLLKGTTFVGGQNWQATDGSFFIDGSTSSASECQPLPDLQIDVCRIAGSVTIENINSAVEAGSPSKDADHFSAVFWDPQGDPVFCEDPWDALARNECWYGSEEEVTAQFPESAVPGIPSNSKSVGSWLEVDNGSRSYRAYRSEQNGLPFYNWESHTLGSDGVETERPEFASGEFLDVSASGDASSYFGSWDESNVLVIPEQTTFNDNGEVVWSSGTLIVDYSGSDGDDVYLTGTFAEGDLMMCKFSDDGVVSLPADVLQNTVEGWGGLGIYNLETGITAGPDGLPIWLQTFSGETKSILIDR
jgi:hypothetical protein